MKGHSTDPGNHAADRLAVKGIKEIMPEGPQIPSIHWAQHLRLPQFATHCKCCGENSNWENNDTTEGEMYDEWVVAQHVYVPKKGSLRNQKTGEASVFLTFSVQ